MDLALDVGQQGRQVAFSSDLQLPHETWMGTRKQRNYYRLVLWRGSKCLSNCIHEHLFFFHRVDRAVVQWIFNSFVIYTGESDIVHHCFYTFPTSDTHDAGDIDSSFQELRSETGSQRMEADRSDSNLLAKKPE